MCIYIYICVCAFSLRQLANPKRDSQLSPGRLPDISPTNASRTCAVVPVVALLSKFKSRHSLCASPGPRAEPRESTK